VQLGRRLVADVLLRDPQLGRRQGSTTQQQLRRAIAVTDCVLCGRARDRDARLWGEQMTGSSHCNNAPDRNPKDAV
jgi:hypothetical protein